MPLRRNQLLSWILKDGIASWQRKGMGDTHLEKKAPTEALDFFRTMIIQAIGHREKVKSRATKISFILMF